MLGMKIAISGKGGVGKTLLASFLIKAFADSGYSVLAIDADSNPSLAAVLGVPDPEKIMPISEMSELIEERTGVKPGQKGAIYRLNPRVDDIPESFAVKLDGVKLMVMGRIKKGGTGCYCPENALLEALVSHLLLARNEVVIMDMEAGVEHLGRATARAVNRLIIVVEPGRRSIETAVRIDSLARDVGLQNIAIVGNRVRSQADRDFIKASLPGFEFLGFIPYDPAVVEADLNNRPILQSSLAVRDEVNSIFQSLVNSDANGEP